MPARGPSREAVMSALFTKLSAAAGFATTSRRLDFDPAQGPTMTVATPAAQPALYLIEDDETTTLEIWAGPTKRIWRAVALLWAKIPDGSTPGVPDGTTPGASVINPLIDAIETALGPDDLVHGTATLGGLVQHVWIDGTTTKVPGDFNPSGQCFASIPISILVP